MGEGRNFVKKHTVRPRNPDFRAEERVSINEYRNDPMMPKAEPTLLRMPNHNADRPCDLAKPIAI